MGSLVCVHVRITRFFPLNTSTYTFNYFSTEDDDAHDGFFLCSHVFISILYKQALVELQSVLNIIFYYLCRKA